MHIIVATIAGSIAAAAVSAQAAPNASTEDWRPVGAVLFLA